jgi:hypothetical protein
MTDGTPDQTSTLTLTFAPIEAALLKAFALRTGAPKPLASLRPLMWLACLALAQWFGLAHLITPEMRTAAIELARRPGRRKVEPDGQSSLLDLLPMNDGRPGVYVSFVRLRTGTVRESSGDAALDLYGCHEPSTAIARAYDQGWVGGPSGNGLRFIPPTIWGLVVDHNSAAFARKGGVDEYIAALEAARADAIEREGIVRDELVRERTSLEHRIAELQTNLDKALSSIAESARLPINEHASNSHLSEMVIPCSHKGSISKGRRTCDGCGEPLPIAEAKKEPCSHRSVTLFDGKRTCNICREVLPELPNEKVTKFRRKAHVTLTANEDPREPLPSQGNAKTRASKGSRAKSNKASTKKVSKGRAS